MIGFNFYPASPRYIEPYRPELSTRSRANFAVGVFVEGIQRKFAYSPKLPAFGAFNCMEIRRLNRATNWLANFA